LGIDDQQPGFISFFALVVAVLFMVSKSAGFGAFNLINLLAQ
jgi:hypothetical protein